MAISVTQRVDELKATIQKTEEMVLEAVFEAGRKVLKALWEEADRKLMEIHAEGLRCEHVRSVWYVTRLGPVQVKRRHYYDGKAKVHRYPLDEALGMNRSSHLTLGVKEVALKLATTMPFRQSAEVLEDVSAIAISHQTIWKVAGREADPHIKKMDQEIEHLLETGELPESQGKKVKNLITEADGVMLSLQREAARKTEIKVSIAYEGWEPVGKSRYRTVNKTTYADVHSSEDHWAGMTFKLYQRYDLAETRTILGGDGAKWIKEGVTWLGAQFQLDLYHLNTALTDVLGPDQSTIYQVRQACRLGDVKRACLLLREARKKAQGEQAAKIDGLIGYLLDNQSGLRDYRLDLGSEGNLLRRTGAMEGNVDKLVVRRMKGRGMSWTIRGCRRMLWLRLHSLDGTLKAILHRGIPAAPPPEKTIERVKRSINRAMTEDLGDWLNARLPTLHGPFQNRPWAKVLKSLTEAQL